MIKKMAMCAVMILILVPAFAMAAGAQGQGYGTAQLSGLQKQQQTAIDAATQEQIHTCLQQGNGTGRTIQTRTCDQDCDMLRNMTRNNVQQGFASGKCQGGNFCDTSGTGNNPALTHDDQPSLSPYCTSGQKRIMSGGESGIGSGDQIRSRIRTPA
jgi:hypothetical protein